MSNITNYSYLIQSMFGGTKATWGVGSALPGMFQFSQLNSGSIQSQLKAAGIDTNSKQQTANSIRLLSNKCQRMAVMAVCLRAFNLLKI